MSLQKTSDSGAFIVFAVVLVVFWVLVNAILWPYTINTWLEYLGREGVIQWWQGVLIGLVPVVNKFVIGAAIITFILMLII